MNVVRFSLIRTSYHGVLLLAPVEDRSTSKITRKCIYLYECGTGYVVSYITHYVIKRQIDT